MSAATGILQTRATRLMDERATVSRMQDDMLRVIEGRSEGEKDPTEIEAQQLDGYRARAKAIDEELAELGEQIEREQNSASAQKDIRARMAGEGADVELHNGEIKYRTYSSYARDFILARSQGQTVDLIRAAVGKDVIEAAKERLSRAPQRASEYPVWERLARAPEHTLSSDVPGLIPDDHIAQIFQVIDASRPLVASANRVPLDRGRLTFPRITGKPEVAVQVTEKTVGDTADLNVEMVEATASTYIGGGNLSWQAINWSTPSALDLWFRTAAADYALKTEQDAGEVLQTAGFMNQITAKLDGTDDYDDWVAAIVEGAGDVYANSGRIANTLYLAPDQFYAFAALIPATQAAAFVSGGVQLSGQGGAFAGLQMVVSRGLDAGVAIVGDRGGLLVAESPGAPVELRAIEAQIGGLEVGVIGAFEAVVVEDEAFALISTAS